MIPKSDGVSRLSCMYIASRKLSLSTSFQARVPSFSLPNSPIAMSQSVSGKVAIVTGAGSGINLAFASALLAKGCNVVLADLGLRPEAERIVNAHQSKDGSRGRAVFQKTDVRDWTNLEQMFVATEREFGRIDIVCPGAGVYEPVSRGSFSPITHMW